MSLMRRRALMLCGHFGVAVEFYRIPRRPRGLLTVGEAQSGAFWTGRYIAAPTWVEPYEVLHELGHWIAAAEVDRWLVNFGCDAPLHRDTETPACEVQFALEPLIGIRPRETARRAIEFNFDEPIAYIQARGWKRLSGAGCPQSLAEACLSLVSGERRLRMQGARR